MAAAAKLVPAAAQRASGSRAAISARRENFAVEHEIGHRFRFDPASLPPPGLQRSASNRTADIAIFRAGAECPAGVHRDAVRDRHPEPAASAGSGRRRRAGRAAERRGQSAAARQRQRHEAVSRERYAGGFNEPYGLAWRGGELLVADQDGIWRVSGPGQRPEPVTRKGVFGADTRPQQPADRDRPAERRAVRRGRLDGQYRGRAGAESDDPALRSGRVEPDDLRRRHAQPDDAGDSSANRRIVGRGAGTRRARRQSAVRLSDPRAAGRVLRLALRLYRPASATRLCRARARQGGRDDRARSAVPGAFLAARPGVSTTPRSFRRNIGAARSWR